MGSSGQREDLESGPLELASLPTLALTGLAGLVALGALGASTLAHPALICPQTGLCLPFSPCLHVLSQPYTARYLDYLGIS